MRHKKIYTPVGVVSVNDILEYYPADQIDPAYSSYDLYVQFEKPGSRSESGLRRELTEVILQNFIPDDYNHFEKDRWSYGGIRSEGHYTTSEIDEDMTTSEYVNEYIDAADVINELKSMPPSEIINITEEL